ncbi:flagellar biosynthetic protein FliO [Glaciimonas sp. GG7]
MKPLSLSAHLSSAALTLSLAGITLPTAALTSSPATTHTAVQAPSWGTTGLLQVGFGLALIIGLIFLCTWIARRLGLQKLGNGRLVKVVASTNIGQRERVVVVEVGSTWLVLGVTSGQISSLHSMPAETLPVTGMGNTGPISSPVVSSAANTFSQKLREALGQKTQKIYATDDQRN